MLQDVPRAAREPLGWYTFVGIERHSTLVLNIANGKRDRATTQVFIEGLRHATSSHPYSSRLTASRSTKTPSAPPWVTAATTQCSSRSTRLQAEGEARYSPAEVSSVEEVPVMGSPDPERICTSIVERSNLSLRMGVRRFTRLTNNFLKKMGEPLGCYRSLVHVLQLLPPSSVTSHDASDGRRNRRSHMDRARTVGGCVIRWLPLIPCPPPRPTHKIADYPPFKQALIRSGALTMDRLAWLSEREQCWRRLR